MSKITHPIYSNRRFPKTYQLSDVFKDSDVIQETIADLEFQKRLKCLASHPKDRKKNNRSLR